MQDELCVAVTEAFKEARGLARASGSLDMEATYQKKVELALADDNCFKVITVSINVYYVQSFQSLCG